MTPQFPQFIDQHDGRPALRSTHGGTRKQRKVRSDTFLGYAADLATWLKKRAGTSRIPEFRDTEALSMYLAAWCASPAMRASAVTLFAEFKRWQRGRVGTGAVEKAPPVRRKQKHHIR